MSGGIQHTSAVSERGIKMKIKRKNVNGSGSTKSETKHEIVKTEGRGSESTPVLGQNGVVAYDKSRAVFGVEREKSPKMKGPHKKEKVKEKGKCSESVSVANGGIPCATATNATNGLDIPNPAVFSQVATTMDQRPCDSGPGRRENMVVDPYEFNAKVEDGIELPLKKMKTEKVDEATSPLPAAAAHDNVDRGTSTCDASTITESDLLGPCEPGTTVVLEGIVWSEQPGALVVNVTWRDKTFVGALLDSTKFEWAPPRFTCESPVSDVETRAPKGRGKRGRGAGTPVSTEKGEGRKLRKGRRGSSTFTAPPSPARSDISTASSGSKRKPRGLDLELSAPSDPKTPKRSRSAARGQSDSSKYIECPEPNCMKKYKHHNGLRYHMTNHHGKMDFNIRSVTAMETSDRDEEEDVSATPGKKDNKSESSKDAETLRDHEDSSPIEDDIPLKEIARSAQQERKAQENSKVEVSKPDTSAKKKDTVVTTPATASCVSTAPVSLPKSSAPVFHLSGASVACLGTSVPSMMSQPACMTTATVTCASAVSGMPICVTSVPSTIDLVKSEPLAVRADQRSKQKTVTRPIVPAPMPMGSLGSPASVSQSSMSPVSAHGQVSPSLKPIQPKPTILGEMPPNRDPLVGLNNGRTKSKKKKKEPGSTNISSPGTPKQPGREATAGASKDESPSKCDRPAVIRSIPSPSRIQDAGLRKEPVVNVADIGKFSADLQRTGATSATVISAQVASAKAMEVAGLVSAANTPSTLSSSARMQSLNAMNQLQVSSALKISTADRKTPVSESALSPAYSDISDANDSGSPQGSPQKKDEGLDSLVKKDLTASSTPPASDVRPFHDGLYTYPYSAQLLYSQNPLGSQMSTGAVKPVPMGKEGPPAVGDKKIQRSEDMRKSAPYMGQMLPAEVKVEDLGDEAKGRKPEAELNPHMFSLQQLQALQIMHHPNYAYQLQNQFAAMRASHMLHRPQGEQELKAMEGWPPQAVEQGNRNPVLPHPKYHQAMQLVAERERETKMSPSEIQEQNLREKQNENHQILKENIELKSQMEKSQLEHQQFQRMSLFQAQKMAVEQQQKLNKPPPKLQSSDLAGVKVSSHSRGMSEVIKVDDGPRDFHRKEMVDSKSKDSHRDLGKAPEMQSKDDKSRLADSVRDMKGKVSSVGLVSSCSAIVSTSAGSAPVVSYANPSHPFMYNYPPHMFTSNLYHQYQPSPIHLPYSAAPVDVDKEKGAEPKAKRSEGEGKGIDSEPQSQQFYSGSVHKIHELGEKPLPSAVHTSSPQPLKGSDSVMATTQGGAGGEKGRDYSSPPTSLPPQRHYHTHHHTHVVRALPPFFSQDNYNGILTSQASIAHSYPPK